MTQGKISDIMRGVHEVKHLDKFEEIADGLKMPDAARAILGLAPKAAPHPASQIAETGRARGNEYSLAVVICLRSA